MMTSVVTMDNIRDFGYVNMDFLKNPPKGMIVAFFPLGGSNLFMQESKEGEFFAEHDLLYVAPFANPWGWMNDSHCAFTDEMVDVLVDYYGYEMPKIINNDVKEFRWKEALFTLSDASRRVKEINPKLEVTCCVHATLDNYYLPEYRGYDRWEDVASCPYFDVFSTTIIEWEASDHFLRDIAERTVKMAKKYGKESERWIHGYYTNCENYSRIDEVVDMFESAGVDRLAAWTYRGGYGTTLAAKDPLTLWDNIGRNYKRVLKK